MVREVVFWMILVCLVNMCGRINVVAQEIKLGTEKKITRIEWSPDGNMLAYVVSEKQRVKVTEELYYGAGKFITRMKTEEVKSSIWLMDVNSGTKKLLTDKGYYNLGLSWSPDGKKIAFSVAKISSELHETTWMYIPPRDIWVINVDGTGLKQLTSKYSSIEPVWSPDGKKIAYASAVYPTKYVKYVDKKPLAYGLHVMNADGTNKKILTRPEWDRHEDIPIGWSCDGKKIIYKVVGFERGEHVIARINTDGTGRETLVEYCITIALSPDMQKTAHIETYEPERRKQKDDIWIFDRTIGRKWRLTFDGHAKTFPRWINEKVIAFVIWDEDTNFDGKICGKDERYLKVINTVTKKELKFRIEDLMDGQGGMIYPYKISPDGKKVATLKDNNRDIEIINIEEILRRE